MLLTKSLRRCYFSEAVEIDCGGIAQLGERLHGMQEVSGSIPLISTKKGPDDFRIIRSFLLYAVWFCVNAVMQRLVSQLNIYTLLADQENGCISGNVWKFLLTATR